MGMRLAIGLLASVLAALPAGAQETRGNINGVVQDQSGVVPGAMVRITNTNTSQTQQLVTNTSGYFEALLLNPGTYAVRVELQGFKTLTQTGISLAVGQTLSLFEAVLPEDMAKPYREHLTRLQDSAPPMPTSRATSSKTADRQRRST